MATSHRFREPRIACLGLSFKADVGDLRESPTVEIMARIAAALPDVKILVASCMRRRCPAGSMSSATWP